MSTNTTARAKAPASTFATLWAIYKRELYSYFITPLAPSLFVVFLLVQGLHFAGIMDHFSRASDVPSTQTPLGAFFGNTVILYVVLFLLVPTITMKHFAEERARGTLESLLTTAVSSEAMVLGKYLSGLTVYVLMWIPTSLYLVILNRENPVNWTLAAAGYAGVLLVGAGYLAIGTLMSALMRTQFLALLMTAFALLVLFVIGMAEFTAKEGSLLHQIATHISVWSQMNDFAAGIIDTPRLVFNATLIVLPLFLGVRVCDHFRNTVQL
jgi:ABC-2 type transport system permease protein